MTDEEVLCTFMHPMPKIYDPHTDWWKWRSGATFAPRKLTLDILHEIEERLTEEQWKAYRDEILRDTDMLGLWMVRLIHASAANKVRALAAVLRPVVEGQQKEQAAK